MTNIATNYHRYQNIERFINDMRPNANVYYLFVGDHIPHSNDSLQEIDSSVDSLFLDVHRKMIMGKMIHGNTDAAPVIRYIPWESKRFTMYDDQMDLTNEDFYCVTVEGSFSHVWKCLDNNNGANSTVMPLFSEGGTTLFYQTSDGYRWKYVATASEQEVAKFKTDSYFPLFPNNSVQAEANAGSLDIIKVISKGRDYDNYSDGTFRNTDLLINGDPSIFNLANNSASTANGFYTGCLIYITGGPGQGQYREISEYVSNTTGNFFKVAETFQIQPLNGTTWSIRPRVKIIGDGQQTINCVASALVNAIGSNSIYRIEVLDRGLGYVHATAEVQANDAVGIPDDHRAAIRPIISPYGGHGFNSYSELNCKDVEVSVTLSNTENNSLPVKNLYQQIGILRNPRFANVEVQMTSMIGSFAPREVIYSIKPTRLNTNCTVTEGSSTLSCNSAVFINQVLPGQWLYLTTMELSAGQIAIVNNIVDGTHIQLASNLLFSCSEVIMYNANVQNSYLCSDVPGSAVITLETTDGKLGISQMLVGYSTGATGTVAQIVRNDVAKEFLTFNQLHKYSATLVSGSFIQNEVVYQGNNAAYIHSVEGSAPNITLYLSSFVDNVFVNGVVAGNTSGAIANITRIYPQEVVFGSGQIGYLENIDPITRTTNQNEQFQIILNY